MKFRNFVSGVLPWVFAVLGLGAAAAGIVLSLTSIGAEPVLLEAPEAARETVISMLDQVSGGDYEGAGTLMLGQPSLGADRDAGEEAGAVLWSAFTDSISYELTGSCYATDSGVAQDVRITALVLDSVTQSLRQRTKDLLQQRLEEAEDVSEIYDEENNFREDVVMDALLEAMEAAIREDATYETVQVRVNLICVDGRWWVVPDAELLSAISGGVLN